jgi:hypothetical protein
VGWAEWNGRDRDAIRRYWRGDPGQVADLAYRLAGSSDLYQDGGRRPYASVNFVTARRSRVRVLRTPSGHDPERVFQAGSEVHPGDPPHRPAGSPERFRSSLQLAAASPQARRGARQEVGHGGARS